MAKLLACSPDTARNNPDRINQEIKKVASPLVRSAFFNFFGKNEALQSRRTIWQVAAIGLFFFFATLPAKADYGQLDDYSTLGNDVANVVQTLGTGMSGTLIQVDIYAACVSNCYLVLYECDEQGYNAEQNSCISRVKSAYSNPFPADSLFNIKSFTWADVWEFNPTHYYSLIFEPNSTGNERAYGHATGSTDFFPAGTIDLTIDYNLSDFYFNLVGITGPALPGPGVVPGNLSNVGVSIAPTWFCCEGSCGLPLSMLPQLGWWGIGATTSRELLWGLDNDPITNSIDFSYVANYTTQIPTSTPNGYHNLNIEVYFDAQLVATGTTRIQIVAGAACASTDPDHFLAFCSQPCAGLATSTDPLDFNNFLCALREFGCWLVVPTPSSISYVMGQFGGLTANFPLAPFTKIYNNLNSMATGTQTITPGKMAIPIYSTTTGHFISQNYNLGSSTAITSHGFDKFRRFESILIWCLLAAAPTIFVLWRLIMPI
jgi:hypothetical protein